MSPDPRLPEPVLALSQMLFDQIDKLEKEICQQVRRDETTARLMTFPGIDPISAAAMMAFAPPPETFAKGRDFSAWMGLTPKQHSSGGKERLGRTPKMGQRDLRRLLITGAKAVVRWAVHRGAREGSWLWKILQRKPRMLVAVALANRIARIA